MTDFKELQRYLNSFEKYNMINELEEYFNTTPKEQIEKDWEESKEYDEIGPTIDEFLKLLDDKQ